MTGRRAREQRRRCRKIASSLELPVPFDAFALTAKVAELRGRPIDLMPVAWQPGVPCGLLVTAEHADYIVYAADTSPLHQQHILVHELSHLVCGHDRAAPPQAGPAATLMPHLPPELVHRVLGRTVYSEPQEQEAELLASIVLNRAVWSVLTPGDPAVQALEDAFLGPAPGGTSGRRQ